MNTLLTGFSGFGGTHLLRQMPCTPFADSNGQPIDLIDRATVASEVARLQPDAVVHLAAQTFVPDSFADPHRTFEINVTGTLNLLTALQASGFKGRMLYVGSSDVYGLLLPEHLPVDEIRPLKPLSPYAASKAAAEALAYQWSQTAGFEIVLARPFNHTGPGQHGSFVMPGFAQQIVEIKLGRRAAVVQVGDIDVTRDFSDVRDIVRAYQLLLERGRNGEVYNVCSGVESPIRGMLETLLRLAGIEAEITREEDRMRPVEQRRVVGSAEKIRRDTGWLPEIPLENTLADVLADWELRLQ